ncbi:hypothetical protein [Sporosarcina beigongshangi]|uniref:hypothetical protein n=1 Tax=Sporosarcina beigongshangi TaxID=2782538 RepID=UPI00193AD6F6|nr:hypothetical protein [Sporosarcina beigongshangi]
MKSKWKFLYAAIATALLLTACGTDTGKENTDGKTNGSANPVEETDKVTEDEQEPAEPDASETPDASNNEMEEAIVTASDEQNYTISVLPDYTLTSEEPGKDSLFFDADGSQFMRIETMVNEQGTYDHLVENMKAILEAANEEGTPTELTDSAAIPTGDRIENATVFANGSVTGIVFERGSMIVRLTIFDSPNKEHFQNFLHMGETIESK